MIFALVFYAFTCIVWAAAAGGMYLGDRDSPHHSDARGPARALLAAPVWPLVVLVYLPKALTTIWRDASSSKGKP